MGYFKDTVLSAPRRTRTRKYSQVVLLFLCGTCSRFVRGLALPGWTGGSQRCTTSPCRAPRVMLAQAHTHTHTHVHLRMQSLPGESHAAETAPFALHCIPEVRNTTVMLSSPQISNTPTHMCLASSTHVTWTEKKCLEERWSKRLESC